MSQLDDVKLQGRSADEAADAGRPVNWAMLVVLLAVGCTLAWVYFWFWVAARILQTALS